MGAWESDPFGNDTACDWKYELEETNDLSFIESTLQKIHDCGTEYLEATESEAAIAAADTISRLLGRFYVKNSYTESLDIWVANHPIQPSGLLVASAIRALDRIITEPSELLELWQESEDFEVWKNHISDLRKRLQ